MMMPYKANNHCLEGRVQAFLNQLQPYTSMIPDTVNYFMLKNTTHRRLSITVRGIHIWNGLASEISQLPSWQQFKKILKSRLLSSYL